MLFAGGSFTSVGGVAHGALVALNPTTGKVLPYVNLAFTGHHNYGVTCTAGASGCANGTVGIKDMDIDASGTHLVAIGDFNSVSGEARDQLALVDLGATSATLDENFQTQAYTAACFNGAFDSYVRGINFSPDGSYFVVAATGGSGTNKDGTNSSCDTAARFETNASSADVRPTWIDYTGQDTFLSVAITGGVVYVGGHERWVNNSKGYDSPGPGAVPRPGLVALNPISGIPFTWNPGRNPRGAGTYVIYPTSTGIFIGSDTDYIGNHTYLHKKLAFFPLAGGEAYPTDSTPTLPGRVYTAGGFASTAASPVLYRVDTGGPTIGAVDNGPDWQADTDDPSQYRNTGSNSAGYAAISKVDSTVPSTTPSGIFSTERWDPGSKNDGSEMHWAFPVPAGDKVDVRLYFANRCTCTSSTGQRSFDVAVNGSSFLSNFDIVGAAGDQTGTMRDKVVTSNGEVDIDLTHEVENPLINGIEIVRQSAPTTFPSTMYRINSAGPAIGATDAGNPATSWLQDANDTTGTGTAFRSGGNIEAYESPWTGARDGSLPSSAPSDLFSTGRWGPHTYNFPAVPGTPVNIKLFLANNCTCTNTVGARQFNVVINGNQVLTNEDIVSDVHDRTGEMKGFDTTTPASGVNTVQLTSGAADNPVVNALQVDQTGATPPPATSDPYRFTYRHFDGTTVGPEQAVTTGVSWGAIRGAFMVNGELIYGKGDGNLYERTYDGTKLGTEVLIDPYDDPYWQNVDTGSGQTFRGQRSDLAAELPSVTSMFFTNGRLYYTLTGSASMHWRWFEPESGIVGSDEFTVNDGNNWSGVAGAFLSGNTLYYANKTSGALNSIAWNGTQAAGTPTVVDTTQNWASRGMFVLADATNPNDPPVADFSASCSAVSTSCTLDATASHDPDGSIADYDWSYDGSAVDHHVNAAAFSHDFATNGHHSVSLTVTDNDGAQTTLTKQITVGQVVPTPTFGGASSSCTSGTAACGKSPQTTVAVPGSTAVGDALLLFVSRATSTTTTVSVPSGWHQLDSNVASPLETDVYYRAATSSDIGKTVTATFSAATKNAVTLADYSGADPNTIEAVAKSSDTNSVSHTTPKAPVATDGSLAVSYWADKSSTTTAWTVPGSVTLRSSQYDTGGGYDTAVLADSGSTVASGTYGGKTATTNAASGKATEYTIILSPAGSTNAPPHAAFTSSCAALDCTFDASGSTDDGSIASYAWTFGDGNTQAASASSSAENVYGSGGNYQVTLTVKDDQGSTSTVTHAVSPSLPNQNIGFVGADTYDNSGTKGTVTVPAATSAGDALLLFESHASTAIAASAPAGWTAVGTTSYSNVTSTVYKKTATSSDGGSSVAVNFSGTVKAEVTVAAYHNVSTSSPIEAALSSTAGTTATHTTPAVSGLTDGSWVVSFWTDKSTTTSAWTPPAAVTKRADVYGTSGGAISALLADSGNGVSGSYAAQTATTNATSGSAAQWSIALTPSS
jgi:hypothetical protein